MSVYQCAGCELHYCAECDGGTDACESCGSGPLCDGCAFDCASRHRADREQDEAELDSAEE